MWKMISFIFLFLYSGVSGVEFACVTRDLESTFLSCTCTNNVDYSDSFESLSSKLGPDITKYQLSGRPPDRRISQLFITDCTQNLRLVFDLDRLDDRYSSITDITFENINELKLVFESVQVAEKTTFVFTDINNLDISGTIPGRGNRMRFFFRDLRRDRATNIIFNRLDIEGTVQLLNFQDIASLRVVNSQIQFIQEIDFFHVDRCYSSISDGRPVSCSQQNLFSQIYNPNNIPSSYPPEPPTRPTLYPYPTRTTLYPLPYPTRSTEYPTRYPPNPTSFYQAYTTESSALPYSSQVTNNPLFIVGMVLLAAVFVIGIPVVLFVRHQNRLDPDVELFS
ncbi:uncharacterized protein LOC111707252 isoform X2 [Eurytemora carolleeae]|uniref:uncharacterized protein LOC111707252 isoform X2 n=1 Tax=Eurytemora carolleeae TaxID=1294199 RepID=UPI000C7660E4|nr:uncharacterized protein LOC111707252 isoform X2 [Eurytemora carolleeae]|eukprot:XP_023336087.1 uncharacterized protein LOC111707252 isoform X2 [Eurytemora affinis]